ncbi:hypothetical protein [Glycomyces harbinensis]|uniref:Tetratricopeptide repeat-containing protein n=1 Tax=Glycomyces harbinensis TaxID=58114 RepID=A0A1G6XQY4_9ACTN|nr:hypothetical protein [Glycomyces harbinensis]SDD80163.1 hypothetical protein SAMN05216270_107282 [Glycomyces harbinensis]
MNRIRLVWRWALAPVAVLAGYAGVALAVRSSGIRGQRIAEWLQRNAVVRINRHASLFPELLSNLGITYEELSRRGFPELLTPAIAAHATAERCMPSGDPQRTTVLSNLGSALLERFERSGSDRDFKAATSALERAWFGCTEGHPDRAVIATNLAAAAALHPQAHNDLGAARECVRWCTLAVEELGSDDRSDVIVQVTWGKALLNIAELTGRSADLKAAVDRLDTAVSVAEAAGHEVSHARAAFASALRRTGRIDDLDRSIAQLRLALEATPLTHVHYRRDRTASLAVALAEQFQRTHEGDDIDTAISLLESLAAGEAETRQEVRHRANLSVALMERADSAAAKHGDLDRAIALLAELTAGDLDPSMAPWLWGAYADGLVDRGDETEQRNDFATARDAAAAAVRFAPHDSPAKARLLGTAGEVVLAEFRGSGRAEALDDAATFFARSLDVPSAGPRTRIRSALLLAHCAAIASDWERSIAAYDSGQRLIPLLLTPDLPPLDGMHLVKELAEASQDAMAASINLGRVDEGLVRFHLWRGLLLGRERRHREQWTRLEDKRPDLVGRLRVIAERLEATEADPLARRGSL